MPKWTGHARKDADLETAFRFGQRNRQARSQPVQHANSLSRRHAGGSDKHDDETGE
jgi:hypothetical protein